MDYIVFNNLIFINKTKSNSLIIIKSNIFILINSIFRNNTCNSSNGVILNLVHS